MFPEEAPTGHDSMLLAALSLDDDRKRVENRDLLRHAAFGEELEPARSTSDFDASRPALPSSTRSDLS